eukprot:TRINITY_DN1609_c0_g1_i1.p1 TRINITY_DN1609_c0_g1~~TRINITY_DN1609_c0_g1_i1.p1  ORF type:complete len:827 (+),score=259.11 TRINITY_DN1609_c0_g1_i1:325-2481(+)
MAAPAPTRHWQPRNSRQRPSTAEPADRWRQQLQSLTMAENRSLSTAYGLLAAAEGQCRQTENQSSDESDSSSVYSPAVDQRAGAQTRAAFDAACNEISAMLSQKPAATQHQPLQPLQQQQQQREYGDMLRRDETAGGGMLSGGAQRVRRPVSQRRQQGAKGAAGGTLPALIESLRGETALRTAFFQKVGRICSDRRRAASGMLRRNAQSAVARTAAACRSEAEQRRAQREMRTAAAQAHVQRRVDEKAKRTLAALARPEERERRRAEQQRADVLRNSWASFCITAAAATALQRMLGSIRSAARSRRSRSSSARTTRAAEELLRHPGAVKLTRLYRQQRVSPEAEQKAGRVMMRFVRRMRAANRIRHFIRDWLTSLKVVVSVRVHRRAAVRVQRAFRDLRWLRLMRRMICSLQWDSTVETRHAQMHRSRERIDLRLAAVAKEDEKCAKQAASATRRRQELREEALELQQEQQHLSREIAELRSINDAIKIKTVNDSARRREEEHGRQILKYVRAQKEVDKAVRRLLAEKKRMQGAQLLLGKTDDRAPPPAAGWEWQDIHSNMFASDQVMVRKLTEREQAIQTLVARGDITLPRVPDLSIVTDAADIEEMIKRARDESRRVIKERLAAGDLKLGALSGTPPATAEPTPCEQPCAPVRPLAGIRGAGLKPRQSSGANTPQRTPPNSSRMMPLAPIMRVAKLPAGGPRAASRPSQPRPVLSD